MSFIFNPDDFDHSNRIHLLEKKVDSIVDGKLAAHVADLDRRVRSLENKNSKYAPMRKRPVLTEIAKVVGIFSLYAQPVIVISTLKNELIARTGLPNFDLLLDAGDFDRLLSHHTIQNLIMSNAKIYDQMSLGQKLRSIARILSVDSIVINDAVTCPLLRASNPAHDFLDN